MCIYLIGVPPGSSNYPPAGSASRPHREQIFNKALRRLHHFDTRRCQPVNLFDDLVKVDVVHRRCHRTCLTDLNEAGHNFFLIQCRVVHDTFLRDDVACRKERAWPPKGAGCCLTGEPGCIEVLGALSGDSINRLMSSTRQAVVRGPSLTGWGKRPSLMPFHHVDFDTGIIAGMGGVALRLPIIWGNRT